MNHPQSPALIQKTLQALAACFPALTATTEQVELFLNYQQGSVMLPGTPVCRKCGSHLVGDGLTAFCRDETCPYSDTFQCVDDVHATIPPYLRRQPITLLAQTDDGVCSIEIDAGPYFYTLMTLQDLDNEILALQQEQFCGGSACDAVLYAMEPWSPPAASILTHCHHLAAMSDHSEVGFSVQFPDPEQLIQLQQQANALLTFFASSSTTEQRELP